MLTLTPTQARKHLSGLLKRSIAGEEIGIVCGGKIIALRPVEVAALDYPQTEYGISKKEMTRIAANLNEKGKKALRAKRTTPFTDDLEKTLGNRR